jgi:hypothetical protein
MCKLTKVTAPNAGQTGTGGSERSRISTYRWSSFPGRVSTAPNNSTGWLDIRGALQSGPSQGRAIAVTPSCWQERATGLDRAR